MDTKNNVISLFEYRQERQAQKDAELEGMRYALFKMQHSDDDSFENNSEFEFNDSDD